MVRRCFEAELRESAPEESRDGGVAIVEAGATVASE
jgi:hypothetical protein